MLQHTKAPIRRWRRKRDGSVVFVTRDRQRITIFTTEQMVRFLEVNAGEQYDDLSDMVESGKRVVN